MFKYFLIRLISVIPKILIITVVIFIGLQLVPGDAVSRMLPPEQLAHLSAEQLEAKREALGLNDSYPEQYFRWIFNLLKGDFGYSLRTGGNIRDIIGGRLGSTFELVLVSLVISTIFGLLLGIVSAVKQNSSIDYFNSVIGVLGVSVPQFFFGLCGILLFGIVLQWLPTGGRMTPGQKDFIDRIPYMIMPALCLGISLIATLMRYTRGSMLDVMGKDYIKVARSKGISEVKVNLKHGFRNALIPVMVILVFRIPILVGGAVVIETVFNYPGMGGLLLDAVNGTDFPLVMIVTLIVATVILVASFLVDIFAALLDPRVRLGNVERNK